MENDARNEKELSNSRRQMQENGCHKECMLMNEATV